MTKVTIRRTFNIGDFETISIEASGEHENPTIARLLASKQILEFAQQEMVRIFNLRTRNTKNSPWEQVISELSGVSAELFNLGLFCPPVEV